MEKKGNRKIFLDSGTGIIHGLNCNRFSGKSINGFEINYGVMMMQIFLVYLPISFYRHEVHLVLNSGYNEPL